MTQNTVTWKSLILETVKSEFGTKEFKRIELVKAITPKAEKAYPDNKNIGTTVGNALSKMKKSGLMENTRKGFWKLA